MGTRRIRMWRGEDSKKRNFYRLSNISRVIKSRQLRWAGHVVRMEECTTALTIFTSKSVEPLGWPSHK